MQRWLEVSRLFHQAADLAPNQRRVFLDAECHEDAALRSEVESLLANDASADAFLRDSPIADALGCYRVERRLGRGGMGAVFLAYDTRLLRRVAIKVIDRFANAETTHRRLLHEARAAAALNHPNICTIHDVDRIGGTSFIVMEYVEGQSLRERIDAGTVPLADVVCYGIQAADALAFAHEHGVVHRDFKAANALTTDKRLKIVDFGLAERRDDGTTHVAVDTGAATSRRAGTPYAMAPEQIRGDLVDARTDIWALGVFLYELVSGLKPFQAPTIPDLFALILGAPPAPLPETVPAAITQIIQRCLEKDPERRYERAPEVSEQLYAAHAALEGGQHRLRRRIAVMPFRNVSGDREQDYFSDGVHDGLITDFAQVSALHVIARPSVLRYARADTAPREIGRELNVDVLLTGSVTRVGDRVRVNAQLVDAATEEHLWAARFERPLHEVLALQGDIVIAVASALQLELAPLERARLGRRRTVDPAAHDAYLRAKFQLTLFTPSGFATGMALLHDAIAIDAAEPLAYAGLAHGFTLQELFRPTSPHDLERAKTAALKAVELDDTLAEAHAAVSFFKGCKEWDYPGALRSIRRALELNPGLAEAHISYAQYLSIFGSEDEATAEWKRGTDLDPLSALYRAWFGGACWEFGRFDDAIIHARKALALQADFPVALAVLGYGLLDTGRVNEAIAAHEKAVSTHPNQGFSWILARTYALGGRIAEAGTILARLEDGTSDDLPHPWFIAAAYVAVGDHEKAIWWLEKAYDARNLFLANLRRERAAGATFAALHGDPRFQRLLGRLNLAP